MNFTFKDWIQITLCLILLGVVFTVVYLAVLILLDTFAPNLSSGMGDFIYVICAGWGAMAVGYVHQKLVSES